MEGKSCWCWTDRYSKRCKQNWREKRKEREKLFVIILFMFRDIAEMRIDRIDTLSLIEECYRCNGFHELLWMKGRVVLLLSLLFLYIKMRNTIDKKMFFFWFIKVWRCKRGFVSWSISEHSPTLPLTSSFYIYVKYNISKCSFFPSSSSLISWNVSLAHKNHEINGIN